MRRSLLVSILLVVVAGCAPRPTLYPTVASPATLAPSTNLPTLAAHPPAETLPPAPIASPRPSNQPGLVVTLGEPDLSNRGVPVFSPDGKVIAFAASKISFWDLATFQLIRELNIPYSNRCVRSKAVYSPDGRFFAVSIPFCWGSDPEPKESDGHVLVWDLLTGQLIREWHQDSAVMPPSSTRSGLYYPSVAAVAFVPDSTKIAFANGNTIEFRDVVDDRERDVIRLGTKMFASDISFSSDGRLIFVFMDWWKDQDFPSLYSEQYKVQVWDVSRHILLREIRYPEGWASMSFDLQGPLLFQESRTKGTAQVLNLQTGAVRDLPYRTGWSYVNADMSYVLYARLFGYDDGGQTVELWNTDTWRQLYSFLPDFGSEWIYSLDHIVFSPDSRLLAIDHQGQVSLWDIAPFTRP